MSEMRTDEAPFYEREVPQLSSWVVWIAFAVVLTSIGVWEYAMRSVGLSTDDIGESPAHWAVERRKVDAGEAEVAIIGASRILFDTDLDVFEEVTGIRPVQLALAGTSASSFLTDLANDPDFDGLLIIGMTEILYFMPPEVGLYEGNLEHYRSETPSQRFGHALHLMLSRALAFIDPDYGLVPLISRGSMGAHERSGTAPPYDEVWKLMFSEADRQTSLWHRIETPGHLNDHAKHAWMAGWALRKPTFLESFERADETVAATVRDVDKIRARGGEVVFVRCPSAVFYQDIEREHLRRSDFYDRVISETASLGLHFEDYESMQGLDIPEWSHLSASDAKVFTRAYAQELVRQSQWLQQRMARDDT